MLVLSLVERQYPREILSVSKVTPSVSAAVCSNGASHDEVTLLPSVQFQHASQAGQPAHTISKRSMGPPCFAKARSREPVISSSKHVCLSVERRSVSAWWLRFAVLGEKTPDFYLIGIVSIRASRAVQLVLVEQRGVNIRIRGHIYGETTG